jgi:hypothetical protein
MISFPRMLAQVGEGPSPVAATLFCADDRCMLARGAPPLSIIVTTSTQLQIVFVNRKLGRLIIENRATSGEQTIN